ncbi:MAG: transglycosylase SLT domain-containing protein [Sulfurovum sp.]|nr:transglycosylase SLT domain-containing protein [Sulfurovum sp.]
MYKGFLVFDMLKFLFTLLFIPLLLLSEPIGQKYPGYSYVFSEFDVDSDYIENGDFVRFVQKNEKKLRQFYKHALKRENGLSEMLRKVLLEEGVSDLFLYVSIAESGLSTDAVSPKSAAGLWQFMPKTAKHYNLDISYGLDERCDPQRATKAAIRHLNALHRKFGKWYLAVMAYNCGEGRMKKAIDTARTDDLEVLLDERAGYLPKETRTYMKRILLLAMIGENEAIDFSPVASMQKLVQVEVAGGTSLTELAQLLDMEPERLKAMNRAFKTGSVPSGKKTYHITIPESKMACFYLRYDLPETKVVPRPHLLSHIVVLGESPESIAKRYESSVAEIIAVNHLQDGMLEADSVLLIPVSQEIFERLLQ